eukprot:CAMPEP_0172555484 /NCGR_PEP_ID=MMETSP1067-20121228/58442_1 /TAXON_ID=265564 ORGANISM="Thalassiosira punctigera, Strain Tpunct2005C2" /NCGR_SAMPLE_ID=MMETSP1067 /ASSEMBLY_ACC=CAM_ASM_000444 /LENGTH=531 /DNA_ID=CAMNT_0013344007 /DNA_START=157 /DNA_END=1752 /DNA_ORIENTATION=+
MTLAAAAASASTKGGAATATLLPDRVDYLVVGGGATGMAFCDTLLRHAPSPVSVAVIDSHARPGGQWNDSYDFVRLHQPSDMYGVESTRLEPAPAASTGDDDEARGEAHRATREEILDYYSGVCGTLEEEYDFRFVGETSFDVSQLDLVDDDEASAKDDEGAVAEDDRHRRYALSGGRSILARKVVDGRYLEPDLPVHVPPKFGFDPNAIDCVPVNSMTEREKKHHVIIGAGKTGMDAITFLLTQRNADPDDILWIVPNEAWITARENIGSCMEFLRDCATGLAEDGRLNEEGRRDATRSSDFFQRGFLQWEKQGRIYRFDEDILPTKFKDATLSKGELELIKKVKRVVRNGRVKSIDDDGTLRFSDGTTVSLPWSSAAVPDTLFVHCSAGAFNYSKQTKKPPPVFSRCRISIQDVYGTPGFCFVGSVIGRLESLDGKLSDEEKNSMCLAPAPDEGRARLELGPSGGDVGAISGDHGLVQRLHNLREWLRVPEIRGWLVGHRLFNLRHRGAEDIDALVEETWNALQQFDIV